MPLVPLLAVFSKDEENGQVFSGVTRSDGFCRDVILAYVRHVKKAEINSFISTSAFFGFSRDLPVENALTFYNERGKYKSLF